MGGIDQWASLADFLAMGGHAGFVWGSFGLGLAVMLIEPLAACARLRRARQAARDATADPLVPQDF